MSWDLKAVCFAGVGVWTRVLGVRSVVGVRGLVVGGMAVGIWGWSCRLGRMVGAVGFGVAGIGLGGLRVRRWGGCACRRRVSGVRC
jgi:hypothetical protein